MMTTPEAVIRSARLLCLSALCIFVLQFVIQLLALWVYLDAQKQTRPITPRIEQPAFRAEPELRREKL
jgi:hypothetical protein